MCRDDPKVVRYSHAIDGGILAAVDVTPYEHDLQLCWRLRTVLASPQYVLARNISKK